MRIIRRAGAASDMVCWLCCRFSFGGWSNNRDLLIALVDEEGIGCGSVMLDFAVKLVVCGSHCV